ncbi:hypothetical protein AMAG_02585 [Allomyces macrogynus ATCC 38327]|uniref:Uncharacterized protein n=1 Tax=Allomyces macrogynus (strain ATCC 38327) TaxID=578462 RepID=A0A0L0S345_ALLM3|nr:hypothetical protein AMAG_02585 [Allomyces macrogynus ATCC 38327]|eukprot:KNE56809.1 hypothetical protein AMAG_02585 [Allomyces macrogynus ATCC 38327]
MSARRPAAATPTPSPQALATPTRSASSLTSSSSTLRRSSRLTTSHTTKTDARHDDPTVNNDGSDSESGSSPDRTPTVPMNRRRNALPPMPHSSSRRSVTMPAPHTPRTPHKPSPSINSVAATPATARVTPGFTILGVSATPARALQTASVTPSPVPPETPAPVPSTTPSVTPRTASIKRKLFHSSRLSRSNSMASLATPSLELAARATSPLAPRLLPLDLASLDQSNPEDYRAMLNALVARACRRPLSRSRFLRACAVLRPILDRDAALQLARVDLDDLPVSVTGTPLAGNLQALARRRPTMAIGSSGIRHGTPEAEDRRLVAQLTAITAFPKRHTAPPPNGPATPRSDSPWPTRSGTGAPLPPDAATVGATPTQPFDPLANLSHLGLAAPDRNLLMRRWQRHRRPAVPASKADTAGKKPAIIDVSDSDDNDGVPPPPTPVKATPPTPDALDRILLEVSATSHATSAASVGIVRMASKHLGAGGRAFKKRKLRAQKPVGYAEAGHA